MLKSDEIITTLITVVGNQNRAGILAALIAYLAASNNLYYKLNFIRDGANWSVFVYEYPANTE